MLLVASTALLLCITIAWIASPYAPESPSMAQVIPMWAAIVIEFYAHFIAWKRFLQFPYALPVAALLAILVFAGILYLAVRLFPHGKCDRHKKEVA